jgi:transaldolase
MQSAAEAFLRGIERRIEAGLKPNIGSVASVFVSRWDGAVMGQVPVELRNRLGIAIAERTYKAARTLLSSPRWHRVTVPARGRSVCYGRARGSRIRWPQTFCT